MSIEGQQDLRKCRKKAVKTKMVSGKNNAFNRGNYFLTALSGDQTKIVYTTRQKASNQSKFVMNLLYSCLPYNTITQ